MMPLSIPHPSQFIDPKLADELRQYALEAEKMKTLHPRQLSLVYAQNWLKLFVPAQYKGLALSLPDALRIEEGIAWADGSTGWTVTLCSGANWFVGFLKPEAADELFSNDQVCLAGSGRASGTAEITENGYLINGVWDYATGASFATAFTANCVIQKNGQPQFTEDGHPLVKAFVFNRADVTIIDNWEVTGMIATASRRFTVTGLPVPFSRSFHIREANALLNHPVYHYPFLQFAEATLAVNISGMGFRFLELCSELFSAKAKQNSGIGESFSVLQNKLASAIEALEKQRDDFYQAVQKSWEWLDTNGSIPEPYLQAVSSTSRKLAKNIHQSVHHFYPYCGLQAANPQTEINRVWRNLHTASQHSLLNFPVEENG